MILILARSWKAMPYIVDGNNVIGQKPGWHRDRAGARRALLEQLARFARIKRVRITVVFDGTPDPQAPEGSAFKGVKTLYARKGSDADTRIEQLVASASDPRGLIVITSDRRLSFAVRTNGARTVRSGEFRKQLDAIPSAEPLEDGEEYELDDLKEWMRFFGEDSEE
jgi:predicted RNA-binding protein with PIN domain